MPDILLTEEERLLRTTVREFAEKELAPKAAHLDAHPQFPWENMRALATLGLTGLTIDPQYGGSGGTTKALVVAIEEIARACAATSVTYLAHLSLAMQVIQRFATEEQKARLLPPMLKSERIGAFCLTEPSGGSDAAGLQTSATWRDGGYVLTGTKTFITNATVADVFIVFATHDRTKRAKGISCFLIDGRPKGLSTTPLHGKMGMRASDTGMVHLDEVWVPESHRLGPEGQGFKVAMQILDASRISVAAQCVGIAQAALDVATSYVQQRMVFGQRLADFQHTQFTLAEMATRVEASRLLTLQAAMLHDAGQPFIKEASMAKWMASETAVWCADRAVQLHGGYGYFSPALAERLYRDARVLTIYEGTSEVQRLIIARHLLGR
ncbi:MAG: acyl-CoA dehydrogenase family protein [Dehalococcoidia bacterium]|nr:acyl-CoA dehydrogenase family protein [Dehalococcoidia bacterium]MDW8119672.1 acyl-CoA dehydrogenase family protein [Chloroflexota bacterium]